MAAVAPQTVIAYVPLDKLKPSPFQAQAERRAHYDAASLDELVDSIKAVGIAQPIVARPVNGHFEIVAGERRWLGATRAKLDSVPVWIRELDDKQALEVQLVENLQREGLHELAEAEGYETLQKQHGYTIEDLVAKVGKSRSYVYGRLKLTALGPESRKAFYANKVSASIALLIARIPSIEDQKSCLEHITGKLNWSNEPMSYREAHEYVQREYMTRLGDAPFPTDDATLVVDAGACTKCPKRTGNHPDLFGDIKNRDTCTDRKCFSLKRSAWNARQVEQAKEKVAETGGALIRGDRARRARQTRYTTDDDAPSYSGGIVKPSDVCPEDPKKRTYAQLIGKDAPKSMLQNESGGFAPVFERDKIAETLKQKHGIKLKAQAEPEASSSGRKAQHEAEDAKRKQEQLERGAILRAIYEKSPAELSRGTLQTIAERLLEYGYASDEEIFQALGWKLEKSSKGSIDAIYKRLAVLSAKELSRLLLPLVLVDEATEHHSVPKQLNGTAKALGIDVTAVRKAFRESQKPTTPAKPAQPEPQKPARKKAAAKASKPRKAK